MAGWDKEVREERQRMDGRLRLRERERGCDCLGYMEMVMVEGGTGG